jgi:hypothetical protein
MIHQLGKLRNRTTSGTYLLEFTNGNLNAMKINNAGNVGIGTNGPGKELTVNGNMEIGTGDADYQHLRIRGGNSSGYFYGAFAKYNDGIHMGYNFYNDNTSNQIRKDGWLVQVVYLCGLVRFNYTPGV